jgi:prevent-host-death family protein
VGTDRVLVWLLASLRVISRNRVVQVIPHENGHARRIGRSFPKLGVAGSNPVRRFAENDHGRVTMVMAEKQISATQFKARCLRLLDEVERTGESLVITKHGRPVARVEPPKPPEDLRGSVTFHISDEEFIYASMPWEMTED